jgi:hypothetical protein
VASEHVSSAPRLGRREEGKRVLVFSMDEQAEMAWACALDGDSQSMEEYAAAYI